MRYLSSLFVSFISICVLWVSLVYLQIGNLTQNSKWTHEAYELKEMSAMKIDKNKVVVVSGSNSLFGIDSKELEKYWSIPVINDSVHAGLGLPYILDRSKKILRKGDVVILPIEYSLYQADGLPSEMFTDFILSRDGEYFRSLPILEKLVIVSSVSFKRLYQGLNYYFNKELTQTKGIYGTQNIDIHGDQINLEPEKMSKIEFAAIDLLSAVEIVNSELSSNYIRSMNEYITWAKRSGVCVIAMPPNYLFFKQYKSAIYLDYYSNIKGYFASRDIKYVGSPFNYMFAKKYYYNTRYHLNSEGIKKRTNQVISDIGANPRIHCDNV